MQKIYLLPALLLLCTAVAACGSSSPTARESTSARPIVLTMPPNTTANLLAAPPKLHLLASAVCRDGGDCTGFTLAFRNPGGNELFFNYAPVTAEVDGEQLSWPEVTADPQQRPLSVRSTFLLLGVKPDDFRKIAQAREVTFHLGSTPLYVSHQQRAPLRQLFTSVEERLSGLSDSGLRNR